MKAGVQCFVILGLALLVPPAFASDFFNILSIPSHDDSELAQPTLAEHTEARGRVRLGLKFYPFDYFRLALQWPPSHCNIRTTPPCASIPQNLTIHGLWPDFFTGNLMRGCYTGNPFTPITDAVLLPAMTKEWPEIERGNNANFWKNQWENHGRCSMFWYPQIDFFYLAIDLKFRFDVIAELGRKNIVPGTASYARSLISQTITDLTSKEPNLACNRDSSRREQLHEVHICFTPVGSVMDCPVSRLTSPCTAANIYFPR